MRRCSLCSKQVTRLCRGIRKSWTMSSTYIHDSAALVGSALCFTSLQARRGLGDRLLLQVGKCRLGSIFSSQKPSRRDCSGDCWRDNLSFDPNEAHAPASGITITARKLRRLALDIEEESRSPLTLPVADADAGVEAHLARQQSIGLRVPQTPCADRHTTEMENRATAVERDAGVHTRA